MSSGPLIAIMRVPIRIILMLAAGLSCQGADDVFGVAATGAAASVSMSSVQGVGGHVYRSTFTLDSATAQFESYLCTSGVNGPCISEERRTGTASRTALDDLFRYAQTREFRELRDGYRPSGDIVPPDGGGTKLTIVTGEREKTITWAKHVTIPAALDSFLCRLQAATHPLILC